jgi:hypothetical protein
MTMKKLVKNWALPDRTEDRQQLTLRLKYDLYAKLHALKVAYPKRSVNDMINDILEAGLDEIIEALPVHIQPDFHPDTGEVIEFESGPRVDFEHAYQELLYEKSEEATKNEAA